jgi:hypothetical protein
MGMTVRRSRRAIRMAFVLELVVIMLRPAEGRWVQTPGE